MSDILKTFADRQLGVRPSPPLTWYLILDCGHWYHWMGVQSPSVGEQLNCPDCKPPIKIIASST